MTTCFFIKWPRLAWYVFIVYSSSGLHDQFYNQFCVAEVNSTPDKGTVGYLLNGEITDMRNR